MYNHTLLSETCEARGLTNKTVANMMGVSEATMSRYLNGEVKEASAEFLSKLCDVLGLSLDVVMGRESEAELPTIESLQGKSLAEILLIIRDFVRRNYDRLRSVEHEKDAAFNRHIDHLNDQIAYLRVRLGAHAD